MSPDAYAALFLACPDPLALVSGELIQAYNPAWEAQVGQEPSLPACFLPEDFPRVRAALEAASREHCSLDARLADGAHAGQTMRWSLWSAGEAAVCIRLEGRTSAVDDALARASSGELRHAQNLMGIVNSLPLVVWAITVDGICTLSAGKNLEQLGLEPGQLIGANIFDFYRDNPMILDELQRALGGEAIVTELPIGERTWRTSYFQACDGTGEVTGLYAISEDITESKQAEQRMLEQLELIQTQKLAIANLVSPIIEVWTGVLVVPVIGNLSDERAAVVTEKLLHDVVGRASRFVILDLTGVDTVEASTAQHLFNIMRSVGLLGSTCLISGIQPSVARTMVSHEIALPADRSYATLAEALRRCLR